MEEERREHEIRRQQQVYWELARKQVPQRKKRKQIIIKDGIINLISGDIDLEGVPPANRGRLSPTAYSYS